MTTTGDYDTPASVRPWHTEGAQALLTDHNSGREGRPVLELAGLQA